LEEPEDEDDFDQAPPKNLTLKEKLSILIGKNTQINFSQTPNGFLPMVDCSKSNSEFQACRTKTVQQFPEKFLHEFQFKIEIPELRPYRT
jgi:hypothetical protein